MAVGSWADRRETIEGWVNTRTAMTLLFVFWATHVVSPKTTKIDFSNGEILSKFFYVLGGTIDSFCISLWPIWPTPSKVSIPNNVSVLAHLPEEYSRVCGSEDLLVYDTSLPQPFVTSEGKNKNNTKREININIAMSMLGSLTKLRRSFPHKISLNYYFLSNLERVICDPSECLSPNLENRLNCSLSCFNFVEAWKNRAQKHEP